MCWQTFESLTGNALDVLCSGGICAIHVAEWVPHETARRLSEWVGSHADISPYMAHLPNGQIGLTDQERLGTPLNSLYSILLGDERDPAGRRAVAEYNRSAGSFGSRVRKICHPYCAPFDRLRVELDEQWPAGAVRASIQDVQTYVGIFRLMRSLNAVPSEPEPHIDWIPPGVRDYSKQFSAICYLQMPTNGGELELWTCEPDRLQKLVACNGGLFRRALPPPTVVTPKVGDLWIINTRMPHAIRPVLEGTRIVQQGFLGFNSGAAIELWS